MTIEIQLRKLESRYRSAVSGAVAAKAHYFSLQGQLNAAHVDIERAKAQWEMFESRKRSLAARMGEVEELDPG